MNREEERKRKKLAERLVGVTSGKNSFIGEFSGPWDGGVIILRDAISHGTKQEIVDLGNGPMPVQVPAPGLLPWFINAPVVDLEVRPDHLYRVHEQNAATQEVIVGMYTQFLNFLRNERAGGNLVQQAKPGDLVKINRAAEQSGSVLPSFGSDSR